jgi:drug/metabolite transporter (DMT)-like permease
VIPLKRIGWTPRRAEAALLLVALIWGSGFIATEYALRAGFPTPLIMTARFWIAALVMLPFYWRKLRTAPRRAVLVGAGAGVLLCGAFFAQTYGQSGTSVSNSAFLTATNVVMVPFLMRLFARTRLPLKMYVLAAGTLAGIGVLTLRLDGGLAIARSDWIVLLCAFLFALHIVYLGTAARGLDAGLLTLLQMLVSALLSTVVLLCVGADAPRAAYGLPGLLSVLYLAVFSTCLCFFLQTAAQQWMSAAKAAILLSTEGLCGSAFSIVLGLEPCTWNKVAGGLMIVACVVLTEVDFSRPYRARKRRGAS